MEASDDNDDTPPGILWSGIVRHETILVEASIRGTGRDGDIAEAARGLLRKPSTPGWEHSSFSSTSTASAAVGASLWGRRRRASTAKNRPAPSRLLKATKFHVYDEHDDNDDENDNGATEHRSRPLVWAVACVYDPSLVEARRARSFVSKMVTITEVLRENDPLWREGPTLAAQDSFAPILLQQMIDASDGTTAAVLEDRVEDLKEVMADNIRHILDRGERIDRLREDATKLEMMASVFRKKSRGLKRRMLYQNAKHGVLLGTAITAGVAVVVVPLVAVL